MKAGNLRTLNKEVEFNKQAAKHFIDSLINRKAFFKERNLKIEVLIQKYEILTIIIIHHQFFALNKQEFHENYLNCQDNKFSNGKNSLFITELI